MNLQMMHSITSDQQSAMEPEVWPGGTVLERTTTDFDDTNERAIYFRGDLLKCATAVTKGHLDRDDVTFFIGASSWSPGQLEQEIERGFWLVCRGPPEIAHSGMCEHDTDENETERPKADLWLSMLAACGEDEARLAHLTWQDDGEDELGAPCDDC